MFCIESGSLGRRIIAVLMSLYVFIAGIPYGNAPAKVEYTVKISMAHHDPNNIYSFDCCEVEVLAENVGRPFITSNDEAPFVLFYRIVNGEKEYVHTDSIHDAALPYDVIVKHGEVRRLRDSYIFGMTESYEPGEYIVEVHVNHSDKVYTATITLT